MSITLLTTLIQKLSIDNNKTKIMETMKKLGQTTLKIVSGVSNNFAGIDIENSVKPLVEQDSLTNSIEELKKDFQECINRAVETQQKDRVVIFIDDLDRLNPEKAVEVLEVLKLFLDCEKCIFVLAIDYEVVCRGVRKKYGEDFKKDKGKSFFDKIIQVPFKMPTAHYQIEKYIEASLEKMNLGKDHSEEYTRLISTSIGYNPRGMKRIFNAFMLLQMVYSDKNDWEDKNKQIMLFAVLCLQTSFEGLYNFIISDDEDNFDNELLQDILNNTESERVTNFFEKLSIKQSEKIDDNTKIKIKSFMKVLCKTISHDKENITPDELDTFVGLLKISGTTSNVVEEEDQLGNDYADSDLEVIKTINNTDIKYSICTFGSKFHIGFGKPIKLEIDGKEYNLKTHKSSKGRIDGFKNIYEANNISLGDAFKAHYYAKDKVIKIEK